MLNRRCSPAARTPCGARHVCSRTRAARNHPVHTQSAATTTTPPPDPPPLLTRRRPLTPPPPTFDVAAATLPASRAAIAARFPELADLVEDGKEERASEREQQRRAHTLPGSVVERRTRRRCAPLLWQHVCAIGACASSQTPHVVGADRCGSVEPAQTHAALCACALERAQPNLNALPNVSPLVHASSSLTGALLPHPTACPAKKPSPPSISIIISSPPHPPSPATLFALPRPATYSERRADGYTEPELILVVATAHLSSESPVAVGRVIRAASPDAVVVELCRSRTGLVVVEAAEAGAGGMPPAPAPPSSAAKAANPWALSGSLARSAELGGPAAMAARVVLAGWAARSAEALTAATAAAAAAAAPAGEAVPAPPTIRLGDDARAAAAAARSVGASLVLGDRPIELTLARAWAALTWRDRAAAAALALGAVPPTSPLVAGTALPTLLAALAAIEGTSAAAVSSPPPSAPSLPSLPSLDAHTRDPAALASMVAALDAASPRLAAALVHERDEWLAWSIARSQAVRGADVVVAVIGAGHVRGVLWHLLDASNRPLFKELAGQGVGRRAGRAAALKKFAVETAVVSGLWAAWQAVRAAGFLGGE